MAKSKCSGCQFWRFQHGDSLYMTPGFHYCMNPIATRNCRVHNADAKGIKEIERDESGYITEKCLADMRNSLPIDMYAGDQTPHRRINSEKELEAYLFGALPYVLSSHYRKVETWED